MSKQSPFYPLLLIIIDSLPLKGLHKIPLMEFSQTQTLPLNYQEIYLNILIHEVENVEMVNHDNF